MRHKITVTHYHNSLRQPIVTVVDVAEADGSIGRGLAICATVDRFNGKYGRKIALGMALQTQPIPSHFQQFSRGRSMRVMTHLAPVI